jgi:hypothetical protein
MGPQIEEGYMDYERPSSNVMNVGGRLRIRKFNVSYLDSGVCPVEAVINELPAMVTSWDPESSYAIADLAAPDKDGIFTLRDTTSGDKSSARRASPYSPGGIKKRRVKGVKQQKATTEDLRKRFDYIRVHSTGKRLGAFREELSFAPADPVVMEYLETNEGKVDGFEPREHCFMMSCGEVQMVHLKMYDIDIKSGPAFETLEDPEAGRVAMNAALDWVQDALELEHKLPELSDLSVDDVKFDPSKSAGAYYRLQGFKTRGEVAEVAREEARIVLAKLMSRQTASHRPTRIGGRGKPVAMSQERAVRENVRKGRAIHMTDTRDGFILGLTEQALNDAWKSTKYPISVGRGWFHGDCVDFVRRAWWAKKIKCYDAEKFDSSLMPYLIHIAVTICRMQFDRGLAEEYDEYWLFVEESLLHSFVYRDDGVMFEKWVGTSSGHNHNSLLQSIVTLILGAFNVFYENRHMDTDTVGANFFLEALGDDNICAISELLRSDTVEVSATRVWKVFGVSWLGNKSFETNALCEVFVNDNEWNEARMFGTAQYLGKYFRMYPVDEVDGEIKFSAIPYRPHVETVIRMLYPEKAARRVGDDEHVDLYNDMRGGRWAGHVLDGSGNPKTRAWLYGLRDFCISRGYECENVASNKMQARWERMGVRMKVDNINWDEFKFIDWLSLVIFSKDGKLAILD